MTSGGLGMMPSQIAFRTTISSNVLRPRRLDLSPPFASTSRAHAPEEETRYNCQLKIRFDAFGGMPSSACEASTHSLSKPTTTSSLWLIGPRAAFAAAVPMVRTAHHRSSAGGNIGLSPALGCRRVLAPVLQPGHELLKDVADRPERRSI